MSNMELWNKVSKTDPNAVKAITGKSYSGNSPKPYYIVQRLTEEFGPCGIGWGFTILNERMERLSETDVLHVAVLRFWFMAGERRGELEQIGQTMAVYAKKDGSRLVVDEDAPKKSVTDALVKCASYLGFAGDIFSGRWDDSKYVAELKREFDPQRAEWIKTQIEAIKAAKNGAELKKIMQSAVDTARGEHDQEAEDKLQEAFAEKIANAKNKPETTNKEPA